MKSTVKVELSDRKVSSKIRCRGYTIQIGTYIVVQQKDETSIIFEKLRANFVY